ncbi:hypothetical protein [Clostridium lundense]|uniref:hypothetical protein n=1 Tax=Clostridium lundense TaxID=319475 RepID=UPI0004839C39|nr:hypothetical protein [Clostridium lundense]
MRILLNELKKIFNLKSILVLLFITAAIYYLFIEFHINVFPNGRPEGDAYRISTKIIKEKGINLKDEDINYLYHMKEDRIKEADNYLKNNKKARELNITSYDSLNKEQSKKEGDRAKKIWSLHDDIMFKEGVNAFWELQVMDSFIDKFQYKEEHLKSLKNNKSYGKRVNEMIEKKSTYDILPWFVFNNYNDFIRNTSILILVSIIFMIAPIFTRDKRTSLELLQYTSKRGRALYKDKIKTALIAAPILITIQLGALFFLYTTRKYTVDMFYNSNINSCFSGKLFWFDMTFIQYIILTVILLYLVGFVVTLIICYVSRNVSNYTLLIGVLIPISLTLIHITESIILNKIGNLFLSKYKVPFIIVILIIVSIGLIAKRYRKEKKIDITW